MALAAAGIPIMLGRIYHIIVIVLLYPGLASIGQPEKKIIALTEVLTLGDSSGKMFSQVGDVAVDRQGNIYVTDMYQVKIKKFDRNGTLLKEYGKTGKRTGDFQSGPGAIDVGNDMVAVSDVNTPRVILLTRELQPLKELNATGPVLDVAQFQGDQLYCSILTPGGNTGEILALYSVSTGTVERITLVDPPMYPTLQVVWMCRDQMKNLIAVYSFRNRIMVYDSLPKLVSSFQVPGLPDEVARDSIGPDKFGVIPRGTMMRAVAVHPDSLIFVLGGEYSPNPSRDMYVLDYTGNLHETYTLPRETGLMYVDPEGFLYTREFNRTLVRKYKIRFTDDRTSRRKQ